MGRKGLLLQMRRHTSTPLPDLEVLTVIEVARIFRVDPTTVRRWVKTGALEAITLPHVGGKQAYRIKRSTLEEFVGKDLLSTVTQPA